MFKGSQFALPRLLARLTALLGMYAVYHFAARGLTLSHYDAKAHLVVSRRILDSITPGWEQIGAVWLPLPHLLNMIPVQSDLLYRTGGFAIAISVLSQALAVSAMAATVLLLTSSRTGAVLAGALFATNPNILYLQSTPMTEPLLFGLAALQIFLLTKWVVSGDLIPPPAAGWVTVLACLTRYEAWPITGIAFVAAAFAQWRRGLSLTALLRAHARLAVYPVVTVIAFMFFSRITVGEWFVSGGFFVPDETLRGQPMVILEKILEGADDVAGSRLVRAAAVAAIVLAIVGIVTRDRAGLLLPLALLGSIALPAAAYFAGHPFRMRYEIPLILGASLIVGCAVGLTRVFATPLALLLFMAVVLQRPPFDPTASMAAEAVLDRENGRGRAAVTRCLQSRYASGTIMMSMGALGHYMHELSAAGFSIRDFLHEGNGAMWDSAFTRGPAPVAEWVLVEGFAEGGDAVIQRHRQYPRLLEDYEAICTGGNVTLYHRRN
jgi:hypothetical protein